MIQLARGLSFVQYTYEGGPLRFTVPFPFLKKEHVRVLVGDPASPRMVIGTWIDSTTIEISDQAPNLTAPYAVTLRRLTPFDVQALQFTDGASMYAKQLNTALRQLLFAHQELREFPVGSTGNPGGGGLPGGDGDYPDIQTIIDLITQSPAFLILQEKIPDVDANAELIMEELLRSNSFFDLHRDHGDKISTAYTRIGLTESATEVLAEQYTELFARVATNESDVAAQYIQLNQAIASETSARVSSMTDLHAQITTETGAAVAQAVDNVTVEVDALSSTVDAVAGTVATHGTQIAATNEALSTQATANGANTSWRQLFSAQFGGSGANGTTVAAAVKTQIDTKVTPAEATSIANTSVTAFANGTFAALQQSYTAYASANDAKWSGTWSLRINGGDPNNPIVAGIALSAYPGGSDFVVQSDRFAIVSPTQYGQKKFPFVVGTVGGLSTVGITGQLLVDGSITANKLTVTSLSAITANMGTVNGGTFKTHTLDANGNVIDGNEFRAEMTNVGTWPLWIGSGVKNENNAVMWVDRSGNAGFKGKVSAPNIVGQFQSSVAVNWTGATTLVAAAAPTAPNQLIDSGFREINQFTLPPPIEVGGAHKPSFSLTVTLNDYTPGMVVRVERLNTSVWELVAEERAERTLQVIPDDSVGVGGGVRFTPGVRRTATISGSSPSTSASQVFRVLVGYTSVSYTANSTLAAYPASPHSVTSVAGFCFGIR